MAIIKATLINSCAAILLRLWARHFAKKPRQTTSLAAFLGFVPHPKYLQSCLPLVNQRCPKRGRGRRVFAAALLAAAPAALFADKFEFKHALGDKSRIVSTTDQQVYRGGSVIQSSHILNRMASEVVEVRNGLATLNAVFDVAEEQIKKDGADTPLRWGESYSSVFERDRLGKISIDKKYFMPSARNVPLFPDRELKPGESWVSQGSEVFDLRHTFEIQDPFPVNFTAHNTYLGEKTRKNKTYKAFSISYNLIKSAEGFESAPRTYLSTPPRGRAREKTPAKPEIRRITGVSRQTLYWDDELGQIAAAEDEFELKFELEGGEIYTFAGTTTSEVIESDRMNREETVREVQKEIEKLNLADVTVKAVREGISISLDDIKFAADSAELLPSERVKLEKIAAILRKYPNRDILVAGHTALAGAAENLRVKLSEDRAAEVASYLLKEKVRAPERIITRGYGSSRPVASNATEEGKRKNRRVEITILEN